MKDDKQIVELKVAKAKMTMKARNDLFGARQIKYRQKAQMKIVKVVTIAKCMATPLIPSKNPPKIKGRVLSFEYPAGTPPNALKNVPLNIIEIERIKINDVGLILELNANKKNIKQAAAKENILTPSDTVKPGPRISNRSIKDIGV